MLFLSSQGPGTNLVTKIMIILVLEGHAVLAEESHTHKVIQLAEEVAGGGLAEGCISEAFPVIWALLCALCALA